MGFLTSKKPAKGLVDAEEKEQESDRDDLSDISYQSSRDGSVLQLTEYKTDNDPDADLRNLDYYHGFLPRSDAEEILTQPGDYLIRKTDSSGKVLTILSMRIDAASFHHLVIPKSPDNNKWAVSETLETTDLGVYLAGKRKLGQPVNENDPKTVIRHSIPRQDWELRMTQIQLQAKVGEGEFGEVFKGFLKLDNERALVVAVKKLKNSAVSPEKKNEFISEARLCRRLHHDNIVKFRGVMVEDAPFLMVLEWADGGSLLSALRKRGSSFDAAQKTLFCVQAAQGLRYLEKNKIVHRDVASRNCLLSAERVKISDFGLSLMANELKTVDLSKEVLPIRWLAPETFADWTFSLKTDVFSFGVLMWEVFTNGKTPYVDLNCKQVAKGVLGGMILSPPAETPEGVAKLITLCQSTSPDKRPTFLKLKLHLRKEYDSQVGRRGLFSLFRKKTY